MARTLKDSPPHYSPIYGPCHKYRHNLSRTTVITGQDIHSSRAPRGSDVDSPQPCGGGRRANAGRQGSGSGSSLATSPAHDEASRHKDLRRKMVFDLHKEIDKSAHTTHLEEISDMDKITDICFNNLRVMMENKKHRKFLHHMNNNAVAKRRWHLESSSHDSLDVIDFTNNAVSSKFHQQLTKFHVPVIDSANSSVGPKFPLTISPT
ncbi:hypothetical protein PoB_000149700, partial [Plakobranchus ocellatus]